MKSNSAKMENTGKTQELFRLDLLQRVLLHNTSINTNPAQTDVGDIYFQIQRTDPQGNNVYSVVKMVNLQQADQRPGIQIYPNPVVNQKILIQFDELQTGNISLELVNTTGQVIQRSQQQLSQRKFGQYGPFGQACQWGLLSKGSECDQ